jgi:hypothetical protein
VTEPRAGRRAVPSLDRLTPLSPFSAALALAVGFALVLALYAATGFAPFLLVLVGLAVVGTDRVVRLHPQARFHGAGATLLYVFVPGLFALGAGLALREVDGAVWRSLFWFAFSLFLLIVVRTEYLTVDPDADTYELARILLLVAIYLTAFLLFIVVFSADLPVPLGMALVGATAFLLTVDILRELEPDATTLWWQSGAVAAVMAEARLALYFLSLADVLAAAFMLLVFYPATGLVQNQIGGRLDRGTWFTYAGVFAAGSLAVLIARLAQS